MYRHQDPDAITAYPRQRMGSLGHGPVYRQQSYPLQQVGARQQANNLERAQHHYRYMSDPALLDEKEESVHSYQAESGRRSAMSMEDYSRSAEESENLERHNRKVKKKKMKHLRSFMHAFIGGLRHKDDEEQENIASTRNRQRDERNGLSRAVAGGSSSALRSGPTGEERSDGYRRRNSYQGVSTSPRHHHQHQHHQHQHHQHQHQQHRPPGLQLPPPQAYRLQLRGLHNHGNTCFMNAVLQCLSNTDSLAEYFVTDAYKGDFNKNGSKLTTSTNITEQFALLLKCMWSGQYNPVVSSRFKEVVGRAAEQYQGSLQHDAQEFFLWLLDNIHEDLNQAATRRYKPLKDMVGRPDEEVAAEVLASHLQRNNSFIQNLFQGQFRSALICPSCSTRSCTFDPYVTISLPLPQRETRPVYVTVVHRAAQQRMKSFGVNVSIDGNIRELRNRLADLCGIHRQHLVLVDLVRDGFHRTLYDDQHISVIHANDLIHAFECPPYRGDNPEAISQNNPSGSKELLLILVVNKCGQAHFSQRFGRPLILRVWRDLTHQLFQSVVLKNMTQFLKDGIRLPEVCRSGNLFKCRVVDGLPGRCVLPTDVDHPFYSPSVDKAKEVSMVYGGPAHIKLVCEWESDIKAHVFGAIPDLIPEPHESVMELRQYYNHPLQTSLTESLKIYTREETLNREDSWFCPHCKQQQQDATKKITLWTLPDVLVVHLKRFRQIGHSRTKLGTLVTFPISSLDMTPFLAPRSSTHSRPSSATPLSTSKIQRSTTKSVHFEDEITSSQPKSPLGRSISAGKGKGRKFLFPRRKQSTPSEKKEKKGEKKNGGKSDMAKKSAQHTRSHSMEGGGERQRSRSPDIARRSASPPAGSESPMSIRSAPSTMERFQVKPHHRYFLPPSPLHPSTSSSSSSAADASRLGNIYDLFAVCNHSGTLSRGHYTAYCKNPTDARWYCYDDNNVTPINDDQLVTSGAYMLFYVRQSLLSSSPLSSSESSQSSCSSANHWINMMPPFRLDLNDYHDELCHLQQQRQQSQYLSQQGYESQSEYPASVGGGGGDSRTRTRLNSTNSVLSAPPNVGQRVSPPAPAPEVESVPGPVAGSMANSHHDARSDAFSAVSLPPYSSRGLTTSLHNSQATPYNNHAYSGRSLGDSAVSSTRHHSMRLGRGERRSTGWSPGGHTPQQQMYPTQQRSHENLHSHVSYEGYHNGHPVGPTRSIPSLPTSSGEIFQTPNRYTHTLSTFTSQGLRQQQQQAPPPPTVAARSNGHIPIHVGSQYKGPHLARTASSNQPESHV